MADWRALEAKVDRKMAATFGESVRLSFIGSDGRVDPDRPAVTIRAIFEAGGADSIGLGSGFRARILVNNAELVIDRSTYDGPMPRSRDGVRALDRDGQPWFEVNAVSKRYSNLIVLSLGASA